MNIIFDLGGVVFNWNPTNLINRITNNNEEKDLLIKYLFEHDDWNKLDQGTITKEDVIKKTIKRSGLDRSIIENIFKNIPGELIPKTETVNLIEELSKTEHNLYVLSNMQSDIAKILTKNYHFWHHFKGIVFSCDVKMIKPNRDIFDHILSKYDLKPEDTIFIDDTKNNTDSAKNLGISTIHFLNPNQLRSELKKIEII